MTYPKGVLIAFCVIVFALLYGCALPSNKPLSILSYSSAGEEKISAAVEDRELIVLLRGRRGSNRNFEKYDWIELIQKRFPNADIVAPNTHLGYYIARTVSDRLHEDIIRRDGSEYARVTVVGVSMGSLGALLFESEYPGIVDQYYLIAPYLGYEKVEAEIEESGGLDLWSEQNENSKEDERWAYKLWEWIADEHPLFSKKVKLGYGRQDRYFRGQNAFAMLISDEDVALTNGNHNYEDFTEMLSELLKHTD